MIEHTPGGGTMVTGAADIEMVRLIALRSMLALEARTGMVRSSRGPSTLALVNHALGTSSRSKKAAWKALDAHIVAAGGPTAARPLA